MVFAVGIAYLAVNFSVTKYTGIPVYDLLDWKSTMGVMIPIGILAITFLIFAVLEIITTKKLKAQGHHQIIAICR